MIPNPEFKGQFDYAPYREFEDGTRRWTDVMSGNWAWKQAVCLTFPLSDPHVHSPSGYDWRRS